MIVEAIANTRAGKLRGVNIDGVYRFLGVDYAMAPVGERRFLPPQPLRPWKDVKDALVTGVQCWQTDAPQMEINDVSTTNYYIQQQKLMVGSSKMGVGEMTEDCLKLNIWSAGLEDGKKRPVMFWSHGGGNFCGAADAEWHDGYNMASKNDVVIVNAGHRLSIFGYLYLAEFGNPKYENSVNLGHQDMVAALKWVHENIEFFGGDPDNVTIFGQSAGANFVTQLMAMPEAHRYFHKAIIQSGGYWISPREKGLNTTLELLKYLNIDIKNLDELQKIPAEEFIHTLRAINQSRKGGYLQFPTVDDGSFIPGGPFDGGEGSALNRDTPVIIGYCKDDERLFALFDPSLFKMDWKELPLKIQKYGYSPEEAENIVDIYSRMLGPGASPCNIYLAYFNDERKLKMTEDWCKIRNETACVPTYSYVFAFEGPYPDLKAIHGVDVPFFFDSAIYAPGIWTVDNRVSAMKLSEQCGAAWASFARTGNPNHAGIPTWNPYDEEHRYSMIFDEQCRQVSDYHSEGRQAVCKNPKKFY